MLVDLQAGGKSFAMYALSRLYCAGCIIAAAAYFAYILFVSEIESKQTSTQKAASLPEALKEMKAAFSASIKKLVHSRSTSKALAATALAFCGAAVQLGSIAAVTHYGCWGYNGEFAPFPDVPGTDAAGRRLLGTAELSKSELEARCSHNVSTEW